MTPTQGILANALAAHRAGRVESAAGLYRIALRADPELASARHLLGFALLQLGTPADAVPELERSLRRAPGTAAAWSHLGLALSAIGRHGESHRALCRALCLSPALTEAAEALFLPPGRSGPPTERAARRMVALAPMRAAGWHALGLARAAAAGDGPVPEAAAAFAARALLIDPRDAPSAVDLADIRRSRRDPEAGRRIARWAVRLQPASSAARVTLAASLFDLDLVDLADRAAKAAATISPGIAPPYANRAQCQYRRGRFDAATADGMRALVAMPSDPQLRANLGSYRLAAGDLAGGWPLFRSRPARRAIDRSTPPPLPEWHGEAGARLLVLAEQGLGDELLFASCWQDLSAMLRAGRLQAVTAELDPRLRPLAERSYPDLRWSDRRLSAGPGEGFRAAAGFRPGAWIAAGDLPAVFRRSTADFPARPGYLVTDGRRAAHYRAWLDREAAGARTIGLCWRSGLQTRDRSKYYPSIEDCRPLFRIPGIRIVVLQYDDCAAELAEALRPGDLPALFPPDLDRRDDLDGVAALIAALDGVASADTAVLALAAAVGAPTVGFGLAPTWVSLGRPVSPWQPSVHRLYREPGESWERLLERVALLPFRHGRLRPQK